MTTQELYNNIENGFDMAVQKGAFSLKDTITIQNILSNLAALLKDYEELKKKETK